MTIMELTPRERSALRAAAHPLRPVVLIGDKGLTEAVLKEIDMSLSAHELIKVRAGSADREARDDMLNSICETLSCAAVHHLGKMLILYRYGAKGTYLKTTPEPVSPAKRKPSEPHTPKKLAAEGKKVEKPTRRTRAERDSDVDLDRPRVFSGDRPARPSTRPSGAKDTAHGIPRRSSLSLRAGARRGAPGLSSRKRPAPKQ
ncbi:MAG: YhbY family RNA-binding protein [Burkholderiaceae bacterium]|jgi:RNA-binding protein|nr:YhbY family RNA-binding protein [Burkholderiaceae bacterium]MDP4969087.1 YhbY family RNA-binding protein [Burkholderiaceae bacterium]MDP5111040.1 YhbY family RNA-binding protein [Burkholderiaceae bacterium]